MKLKAWVGVVAILIFASRASANSTGLFADENCSTCNLAIAIGETGVVYVCGVPGIFAGDVAGVEMRIVGLPPGWTAVAVPNPAAAVVLGDVLGAGANLAFPTTQPGQCVLLWRVIITAQVPASDVTLRVTRHLNPSNPQFACPRLFIDCGGACDTWICSLGGEMFINSPRTCTVGVEPSTWSSMKELFR